MKEKLKRLVITIIFTLTAFLVGVGSGCGITAMYELQQVKSELTSLQFDYYSGRLNDGR